MEKIKTRPTPWALTSLKYGLFIMVIFGGGIALVATAHGNGNMWALAITAFTFGLQHAFDADHITAIDNMTRKLINDGRRAQGVGFHFSFGHSLVVLLLALVTIFFVEWAKVALPSFNQIGGPIGALIAGIMLIGLAIVNMLILRTIWRQYRQLRQQNDPQMATLVDTHSKIYRMFIKLLNCVQHNWQVAIVGFLFGLGFDTATQIAVLATSASASQSGVPWYAVLGLPLLFTSGMCLMDTLDGLFMCHAYNWIFSSPSRKVFYNLVITGVSIAAALFIGIIDLAAAGIATFGWDNAVTRWFTSLDLNHIGIAFVIIFLAIWAVAIAVWHTRVKNHFATYS